MWSFKAFMALTLCAAALLFTSGSPNDISYQQYFRFIERSHEDEESWFSQEVQGLAHDNKFWYITDNGYKKSKGDEHIWKVCVTEDLGRNELGEPAWCDYCEAPCEQGVQSDTINVPIKSGNNIVWRNLVHDLGYNHFGDPDVYKASNGEYYLLVPLEGGPPAVAVFRTDNLRCIGYAVLPENPGRPTERPDAAGWVAVDREGYIYTSPDRWDLEDGRGARLFKYRVNWDELTLPEALMMKIDYIETIILKDENGNPLDRWSMAGGAYAQGGEFSPDGRLLYVTSGGEGENPDLEGITVFDTWTWRRIARSTNEEGEFFYYDPINGSLFEELEAEGLTVWDLDEGVNSCTDPFVSYKYHGQLHVLVLENELDEDDFQLYHYTNTIYVESTCPSSSSDGRLRYPFKKVSDALAYYNANQRFDYGFWTACRIKIHAGRYVPEALTFDRTVQITGWGEAGQRAIFGNRGQIAITPEGGINIKAGGIMRVH